MWLSEKIEDLLKEGSEQMIGCRGCQTWSHVRCDLLLLDDQIKSQLFQGESQLQYSCQRCRRAKRLDLVAQLIADLEKEDKNGYFLDEFWLESEQFSAAQSKQYLRQIKNPLCFATIKRRMPSYLESPEQLQLDCLTIFLNAKNYNRQNSQVYKDADKMYQACHEKLATYLPVLEKQAQVQQSETQYL